MNEPLSQNRDPEPIPSEEQSPECDSPKTFDFEEMAEGQNLVLIRFNGVDYRLQRTRKQRLILQK